MNTSHQRVSLVDSMGTDLSVVNAARVSFDKASDWETIGNTEVYDADARIVESSAVLKLPEKDVRLIHYLARHNHWSPFAHTSISLRIKAPIFVARQLVKHQVGGVWNEVSRRYVDSEPEFYFPEVWRGKPVNAKQGSDGVVEETFALKSSQIFYSRDVCETCLRWYEANIDNGMAPEQARMLLPQNIMTEWVWTGSLLFFHRVFTQRSDLHAQQETQEIAKMIADIVAPLFPVSWDALTGV